MDPNNKASMPTQQQQNQPRGAGFIFEFQIPPGEIKQRHLASSQVIAKGDLYYGDGSNNFIRLPVVANAALIVKNGVPTWQAGYTGTITTAKLTAGGTNGSITVVNGIITAVVAAT